MTKQSTKRDWPGIIEDQELSGQKVSVYCRQRDNPISAFYKARSKAQPQEAEGFCKASIKSSASAFRCIIKLKNGSEMILENPSLQVLKALMGG